MEIFYLNKTNFKKESYWLKSILDLAATRFRSDWVIVVSRVKRAKKQSLKYVLENKRNKTKCEVEYDGQCVSIAFYRRELPDISKGLVPDWNKFKDSQFLDYRQDSQEAVALNQKIATVLHEHLCKHTPYSLGKQERIRVSDHSDLLCKKIQTASHEDEKIFVTFDDNTTIEIPHLAHLEVKPSNCLLFKKELGYRTVCQMECSHFYSN